MFSTKYSAFFLAAVLFSCQVLLPIVECGHHGGNNDQGIAVLLAAGLLAKLLRHHHKHEEHHVHIPVPVHHGHHEHHEHHGHHGSGTTRYIIHHPAPFQHIYGASSQPVMQRVVYPAIEGYPRSHIMPF